MCVSQLSPGMHTSFPPPSPSSTPAATLHPHILLLDFQTLVPSAASPWQFSPHPLATAGSSSVGLHVGQFCPRGAIRQCLEIFSIVITWRKVVTSMQCTETDDAAKHLTVPTPALQHKVFLSPKCQQYRDLTGPHFTSQLPWKLLCPVLLTTWSGLGLPTLPF